jgi:hypothetical protein
MKMQESGISNFSDSGYVPAKKSSVIKYSVGNGSNSSYLQPSWYQGSLPLRADTCLISSLAKLQSGTTQKLQQITTNQSTSVVYAKERRWICKERFKTGAPVVLRSNLQQSVTTLFQTRRFTW